MLVSYPVPRRPATASTEDSFLPRLAVHTNKHKSPFPRSFVPPSPPRSDASSSFDSAAASSLERLYQQRKDILERFLPPPPPSADAHVAAPLLAANDTTEDHDSTTLNLNSISRLRQEALSLLSNGEVQRGMLLLQRSLDSRVTLAQNADDSVDPKEAEKAAKKLWKYAEELVLIANGEAVRRAAAMEPRSLVQQLYAIALQTCLVDEDGVNHTEAPVAGESELDVRLKYFSPSQNRLVNVLHALVLNNIAAHRRLSQPAALRRVLRTLFEALTISGGVLCSVILYNIAATFLSLGRFDDAIEAVSRCIELSQLYIDKCLMNDGDVANAALIELCALHIIDCHHLVATLAAWSGDTEGTERYHAELAAGCASTYLHSGHPQVQRCINRVASVSASHPPLPANDATRELVPPQLPLRTQGAVNAPLPFSATVIPVSALLDSIARLEVPVELRQYCSAVRRYLKRSPAPVSPSLRLDQGLVPHPPAQVQTVRHRGSPFQPTAPVITALDRTSYVRYRTLKATTADHLTDPFLRDYLAHMDDELGHFSEIIPIGGNETPSLSPDEAALRIQLFYRRHRRGSSGSREKRSSTAEGSCPLLLTPNTAATRIQRHYRDHLDHKRRQFLIKVEAATKIQSLWRMFVTRRRCAQELQFLYWDRHVAACKIQRQWRRYAAQSYMTDRWFANLYHQSAVQTNHYFWCAVIRIQSAVRMFLARQHLRQQGVRCLLPVVWNAEKYNNNKGGAVLLSEESEDKESPPTVSSIHESAGETMEVDEEAFSDLLDTVSDVTATEEGRETRENSGSTEGIPPIATAATPSDHLSELEEEEETTTIVLGQEAMRFLLGRGKESCGVDSKDVERVRDEV